MRCPTLPGSRRRRCALFDSARRAVQPTAPGRAATMYVCGITPYDATHLGHAATMITFDLVQRVWRDAGHDGRRTCRTSPTSTTRCWSGPPATARTGSSWRCARPPCSARTWRRCGSSRRQHYVGAVESIPRDRRAGRATCSTTGAAYRLDDGTGDVYFDDRRRARASATSRTCPASEMLVLSAERGGDPERAGKRDPLDPLLWRGARDGEPAWDGGAARPRPARLAHRVRRRSRWACSATRSTCRAAATTCSSRTTSAPPRTPRALTGVGAVRPPLRARRHDRAGRREDVQVQGQPGLRVPAARPTASTRWRCGWRCSPTTTGPTGSGPTTCSRRAQQRLARWREAAAARRPARRAPTCWPALRARLADDLDTPAALARGRRLGRRRAGRRGRRPPTPRRLVRPHGRRPARRPPLSRRPPLQATVLSAQRRRAIPLSPAPGPGRVRAPAPAPGSGTPRSAWSSARARSPGPPRSACGSSSYATCSRCSTGVSGRICRISASSRLGWRALIVSVAEAYRRPSDLLDLLVERAAERLVPLQAVPAASVDPEPGRADLDRGVLGAHEVPADQQLGAVADAERVGHLRRRGRPADLGEVLPVPGGEVGVVAAVRAVPAAGEPVEPARVPRTYVPEPGLVISTPSTRSWSTVRCTVCLATPNISAIAGIDGSRSPGAQSPRRICVRAAGRRSAGAGTPRRPG